MTSNETDQPATDDLPERTDVRIQSDHSGDFVLQSLTAMTQKLGMEMDVTVTVSGTVITGLLVSRDTWLDLLADMDRQAGGAAEVVLGSIRSGLTGVPMADEEDVEETPEAPEKQDRHVDDFLHLKNARLVMGNGVTEGAPMLWRIRTSEVSGWMIGSIRTD